MTLTKLEARLLAQIKSQPYATQKELGDTLGISRASVANYVDRLQSKGYILGRAYVFKDAPSIVCIGGTALDRILRLELEGIPKTSMPATSAETRGGVARNVAENLVRLGETVKLISIVGNDNAGQSILEATEAVGVDTTLVERKPNEITGTYTAIMQPSGELYLGVADMGIFRHLNDEIVDREWKHIIASKMVFADTNCDASLLQLLIKQCEQYEVSLAIDAVSIPKFKRLPKDLSGVKHLFCNLEEAKAVHGDVSQQELAHALASRGVKNVIVTSGNGPVACLTNEEYSLITPPTVPISDVSGAGDAFVGGTIHAIMLGQSLVAAAKCGVVAASLTIQSELRNSPDLTSKVIVERSANIQIQGN